MHKRIQQILEDRHGNYILPLFWQHGENEKILREEMQRIYDSGIKAVCVESRPHPDFCGPQWWRDLDIIMDEARKKDMKVWVFDDSHFPTGYANGWIKDRYPEHKKIYLDKDHMDIKGPQKGASILLHNWINADDKLLAVIALQRESNGNEINNDSDVHDSDVDDNLINLTEKIVDDRIYWDIPDGYWRIFFITETQHGGGDPDYLNPIDPDSCYVLIEAVYEKHYERYSADFGNTFAGFFSDEPNIGNGSFYDGAIGRKEMVLPWRKDLLQLLQQEFQDDILKYLPGLWYDIGSRTWPVRYTYMDIVSKLYGDCFAGQLGQWCRDHGVEYIGHIIEDNEAHTRLGHSCGHFFRSMWGQDMSGIDVVLWQIRPGFDRHNFRWPAGEADGEFFHYELAKLGASLAHIDPDKRGRALCEIFGAYGWTEGLKLMKWLLDHMLVRGINWFMPHAFSPAEFPDKDCPPHFYAQGYNPQYRYFRILMNYTNRICHLLNGGSHVASAAILYHAEAEWSGNFMSTKKPLRVLMQSQIDADIIPADILDKGKIAENKLLINQEEYSCIIIPWAERLPQYVLAFIDQALDQGLKVVFVKDWPVGCSEAIEYQQLLSSIKENCNAKVVDLNELPDLLQTWNLTEVEVMLNEPYLRSYHYKHKSLDIYMLFNEDPNNAIKNKIKLPFADRFVRYDGFKNKVFTISTEQFEKEYSLLDITLKPYESMILLSGNIPDGEDILIYNDEECKELACKEWKLSLAKVREYPDFRPYQTIKELINLHHPDYLPDFSGTIKYETTFNITNEEQITLLNLGEVYETAEVWLNGKYIGVKICPPYIFDIKGLVKQGENKLRIDVTNTLVYELKDGLSKFSQQEPVGLLGPITIL